MSVLVVVSHPKPESLNHAAGDRIAAALESEGTQVHVHDLYREHFQPVLEYEDISRRFSFDDAFSAHARELKDANGLVLVYPDWWGMPPAILKGWIDRMFRPGIAFEFEGPDFAQKQKVALFEGKRALVVSTTNETNPLSQEAMYALWRDRVFSYVGIEHVTFKTLYDVRGSSGKQRRLWLQELDDIARRLFA